MKMTLSASPKKVTLILILVAVFLILVSAVAQFIALSLGIANSRTFGLLFVGEDESIPAWYSSIMLLFCSVLLAVIAYAKKVAGDCYSLHWRVLSAIFLFLSVDEGIRIHEKMAPLGRLMLEGAGLSGGFVIRAWVVPGAILVLIVALAYLRFLVALPQKTRNLFLLAGLLFVGGAMGMEMLSDLYVTLSGGVDNMSLVQIAVRIAIPYAEESLEMLGVIVFIYALMLHLRAQPEEVRIRVG
jgi:hypothetical protein